LNRYTKCGNVFVVGGRIKNVKKKRISDNNSNYNVGKNNLGSIGFCKIAKLIIWEPLVSLYIPSYNYTKHIHNYQD